VEHIRARFTLYFFFAKTPRQGILSLCRALENIKALPAGFSLVPPESVGNNGFPTGVSMANVPIELRVGSVSARASSFFTYAYVSIRQHTSRLRICERTRLLLLHLRIRQHTSTYVSIRMRLRICERTCLLLLHLHVHINIINLILYHMQIHILYLMYCK
jgi:hypothetical protein